jgi:hypothetical protein
MLRAAAEQAKKPFEPVVLPTEEAVGAFQLAALREAAAAKPAGESVSLALLGGRGAQNCYARLRELAEAGDPLIARLDVYCQDAFVPMSRDSSLTFVRDFERQLGAAFFDTIRNFFPVDSGAL